MELGKRYSRRPCSCTGAAGNFLAPISKLSENGFRTVIEIDTVRVATIAVTRQATTR